MADCDCAHQCPHSAHCIALMSHKKNECWVLCDKDRVASPTDAKLPLDARFDFDARDVPLARLGEFLGLLADAELYIPAARASEPVTLTLTDVPLGDVVDRAGLVVAPAAE